MTRGWRTAIISSALLAGAACVANQAPADAPATVPGTSQGAVGKSILAWSKPAAGSISSSPVNELVFHFSPPARLDEVTVTGPDGTMPMMVSAVGEVEHYSLPLAGLGSGRYDVAWRASAGGVQSSGRFIFEVN